jgi:hypothetical protein
MNDMGRSWWQLCDQNLEGGDCSVYEDIILAGDSLETNSVIYSIQSRQYCTEVTVC